MRKLGRRTRLTEALTAQICKCIESGLSQHRTADLVGVGRSTLLKWKQTNREFRDHIKRASAVGEQELLKSIRDAKADDWHAAAWMLERLYPERYGKHVHLHSNGDGEKELPSEEEQRKRLNQIFNISEVKKPGERN